MPPAKSLREHLDYIRANPNDYGSLLNTIDDMLETPEVPQSLKVRLPGIREALEKALEDEDEEKVNERGFARDKITEELEQLLEDRAPLAAARWRQIFGFGRRRSQSKKFGSCVKAVRKTVKARKGSSAEGAAIAICTKSILFPRGRTLKRYKKGRLTTQKRRT